MKKALPVLAFMAVVFLLASCKNEDAFTYNYYNKDEKAILDQHLKLNDTPEDYDITLPAHITPGQQALLSDPQTSGGLLVSCAPECEADVLACFAKYGFADARTVGRMMAGSGVEVL